MPDWKDIFSKPKFDLNKELDRITDELRTLLGDKEFLQSDFWSRYKAWANECIEQYTRQIHVLLENPRKYADELMRLECMRRVIIAFITAPETKVKTAEEQVRRIQKYEKIIRTATPLRG